jgi:hypothetical protein
MGKGRHNTRLDGQHPTELQETITEVSTPHRLPTLSEIKLKIPGHCLRPTVRQSMSYVFKDIFYVAVTFLIMYQIRTRFQYGFLFFPLYWYWQGWPPLLIKSDRRSSELF